MDLTCCGDELLLTSIAVAAGVLSQVYVSSSATEKDVEEQGDSDVYKGVRNRYLAVYCLATFGDWIQGGYQYAIYREYGFSKSQIGYLFIVGYAMSATLGTYMGAMGDHFGQRRGCVIYGLVYSASCLTLNSGNVMVLVLGRLLGGLAYSLLYSSFEAWMIAEARAAGLADKRLSQLFATSTFGNATMAAVAGVVGQLCVSGMQLISSPTNVYVAPFNFAAVTLLGVSFLALSLWKEHLGAGAKQETEETGLVWASLRQNFHVIRHSLILRNLALINGIYEAVLFVFVFMWTPILEERSHSPLPHGLIFSLFMLCKMVGSNLFKLAIDASPVAVESPEVCLEIILIMDIVCFLVPIVFQSYFITLLCFCIFELSLGLYWPIMSLLRSQHIRDESRSATASLFRVTLNILTAIMLLTVGHINESAVFFLCVLMLAVCSFSARTIHNSNSALSPTLNAEFELLPTGEEQRRLDNRHIDVALAIERSD